MFVITHKINHENIGLICRAQHAQNYHVVYIVDKPTRPGCVINT